MGQDISGACGQLALGSRGCNSKSSPTNSDIEDLVVKSSAPRDRSSRKMNEGEKNDCDGDCGCKPGPGIRSDPMTDHDCGVRNCGGVRVPLTVSAMPVDASDQAATARIRKDQLLLALSLVFVLFVAVYIGLRLSGTVTLRG